jgi:acylphosphatase
MASRSAHALGSKDPIEAFDFQITGKVQGVFFRKFTQKKAVELRLTGWVQNDAERKDLVVGHAEGAQDAVLEMKRWLSTTGSPKSRIAEATFSHEQLLARREFVAFDVRKGGAD